MAVSGVAVETLSVTIGSREEQISVLSFVDRRSRPARRKQWLLVRSIERLLFSVGAGDRSTGAFAAHLARCSMADAPMCCEKALVNDGTLTQAEFDAGELRRRRCLHSLAPSLLPRHHPLTPPAFALRAVRSP